MSELIRFEPGLNAYLFGCLILLGFWALTLCTLLITRRKSQLPEFWWASVACAALGVTEPLFVPEYWDPPSILKFGRWDLESFLFCFAIGGIAAVVTELPRIKAFFVWIYFLFERLIRLLLRRLSFLTLGRVRASTIDRAPSSRLIDRKAEHVRIENMLLITFFVGLFGATAHFGLNVIYDAAFVCVGVAVLIGWRRPGLRWQLPGGAITFTAIYSVVLVAVAIPYPDFYEHWNHAALSGRFLFGAPIEEYLFAFTFGLFWAPIYEVWKALRS